MRTSHRLARLAAPLLLLGLAACAGGGPSDDEVTNDLVDRIAESADITVDEAECFADVLIDQVGLDEIKDVDFSAEEPDVDQQEDFAQAAIDARDECNIP